MDLRLMYILYTGTSIRIADYGLVYVIFAVFYIYFIVYRIYYMYV
jgi:hypothetical protein